LAFDSEIHAAIVVGEWIEPRRVLGIFAPSATS
jgi:hypothetical protein